MHQNLKAFLDMIAWSELGNDLLFFTDRGYDVIVGSRYERIIRFRDYSDHPRVIVQISAKLFSTAAGRYQILERYFDYYKKFLSLPDFSPGSQDAIAIQLIKECHALEDIEAGNIQAAIKKCASRWASLPGAGYGQREHNYGPLLAAFESAGGICC